MHLGVTASIGAASFGLEEAGRHALPPLRLAAGTRGQPLCVPGLASNPGRSWYAGLAPCFEGGRDVFEVRHPGIDHEDAVARDLESLTEAHVTAVRQQLGDRRCALAGHSVGDTAAHVLAARLASLGAPRPGWC